MNYIKYTLAVLTLPVLILAGCEDRYRYACQDPKNWDTAACQKPYCEIHRTCPEHVFSTPNESFSGISSMQTSCN
jgi:hypothetical protein